MDTHHLLVQDYMQKDCAIAHKDETVQHIVNKMITEKTNGLVVVDDQNCVVGILSSWDIIKHIVPDYLEGDVHLANFEAPEVFKERIIAIKDDPISKFMTKDVQTCSPQTSLIEAAAFLTIFHIRQLPIVDEHNHLIGYINRTDLKLAAGDVLNSLS